VLTKKKREEKKRKERRKASLRLVVEILPQCTVGQHLGSLSKL